MNDLVEETISFMFTNGGFSFTNGKIKIDIFLGTGLRKNQLIIRNNNWSGYGERTINIGTSYCIPELISILEYCLFERINGSEVKDDKFKVLPIKAGEPGKSVEAACNITSIYCALLSMDRLTVREVINGEDYHRMADLIYKENPPKKYENLEILLEELREKYAYFLRVYKKELESIRHPLVTVKETPERHDNFKIKDLAILKSVSSSYEFIDEKNFLVNPAVGREKEIRRLGAAMMSPSLSSILIGHPGVGKTAIVEGLAYGIQNNNVGNFLNSRKILKISPSSIVAGCRYRGDFEKKMELLIMFLKSNNQIILYMDELHTALGAGSAEGSRVDLLDILKPYIEDGSIKVIGATTIKEYDKYLQKDQAFTRRFDCQMIKELDKEHLMDVLKSNIEKCDIKTGLSFAENESELEKLINVLLEITKKEHRSYYEVRYNPALSLSIIEMAYGLTGYDSSEVVGGKYLLEAIELCDLISDVAKDKARRMIDIPTKQTEKGIIYDFASYNN